MSDTKIIRIIYLVDLFLSKYFPDYYEKGTLDKGKVRLFVGDSCIDKEFFDEMNTDSFLTTCDFESFKTLVYGSGRSYFRFNDKKYNHINHTQIKTIDDAFKLFNENHISVHFHNGEHDIPVNFVKLTEFVLFQVKDIILKHKNVILQDFKDLNNSTKSREIIKDYFSNILFIKQDEFEKEFDSLADRVTTKIVDHFSQNDFVYVEKGIRSFTYIFSNESICRSLDINDFMEKSIFFQNNSSEMISDIIKKNQKKIEDLVENIFQKTLKEQKKPFDTLIANKNMELNNEQKSNN